MPSFLSELFPSNVRTTGLALIHNINFTVVGGLSLLICTWLANSSNHGTMALKALSDVTSRSREPPTPPTAATIRLVVLRRECEMQIPMDALCRLPGVAGWPNS